MLVNDFFVQNFIPIGLWHFLVLHISYSSEQHTKKKICKIHFILKVKVDANFLDTSVIPVGNIQSE